MDDTKTVLDWLTRRFPEAKKTTLRDMVTHKRVRINGSPVKSLKQAVAAGDAVEVADVSGPKETLGRTFRLKIVYQDSDIIVVDKPSGLLTSTHPDEPRETAIELLNQYALKHNYRAQVLLIHRIDRDASGLLVFARNDEAFGALKTQFETHSIIRRYVVLVHGTPRKKKDRLVHRLLETDRGLVHITTDPRKGQEAILDYEVVASNAKYSRLMCQLYTGRKHQIRVQMTAMGHAVCCDDMYGQAPEPPGRLALHATHLTLKHPSSGKVMAFDSPPPGGFLTLTQ